MKMKLDEDCPNLKCRIILSRLINLYIFLILIHGNAEGGTPAGGPVLLYTTAHDIRIKNTTRSGKMTTIVDNLEEGQAVDFYSKGNLICWSDSSKESIQCVSYNGTNVGDKVNVISSGLNNPNGLAIDWYTEKLYWTDGDATRIEVVTINGTYRKVLFWSDIDQPRAIAVAPMKGLLFWTDWGEIPKIERAGMNGDPKTRQVIVTKNIFWPNGLTIDYEASKIYWLDGKLKFIDVMDFDGKNRKTIVQNGLVFAFALTMFNTKLYWTDWKTWLIHSWDMETKGPIKEILTRPDIGPLDITVWDARRQPPPLTPHPCAVNNGNCSHLCLLSPDRPGYSCACPTGVTLLNEFECAPGPQSHLVLALRRSIKRISLDSEDFTTFTLPLHGIKHAIAVAYDPVGEYIYWTDDEAHMISHSHLDGSNQSVVISGELGSPDGIAIDVIAGNLYWTDPTADTISTARLNGSSRKVLISDNLFDPRGIAVAPSLGWMFWSDWYEKNPKIERASLDGSNRTLLVSTNLGWPNGIALDIETKKIYWGDAHKHMIEVCNMDGSDRREILTDNLPHIFGLSLLGDYIYWTDWQWRSLSRVNKITGTDREIILEQLPDIMGVTTFQLGETVQTNPCGNNNGNCSHLCFNRPYDFICDCPIGLELSKDNKTCVLPSAFLLYAKKERIGRLSIENSNNNVYLPIKDVKDVSALAINTVEGKLYWADTVLKNIGKCDVNGSNAERIVDWTNDVEGIAIDWSSNNIYWTDLEAHRIEVAKLDGSNRRTLIWQVLRKPKSIVLDPSRGYMYWSEWGSKSIKKAAMDGTAIIILLTQVGRANALTIDAEKGNLYWVTLEPAVIEMADLNGANRKKLIVDNIEMPYAMTLYENHIYWADWTTGVIESALKGSGGNRTEIYSKVEYVSDMVIHHASPQVKDTPCNLNNGGCSHLCLTIPSQEGTKHKCACGTHYTLNKDNVTCSAPDEFLLFSQRNGIGRIIMGGSDCPDAMLPINGRKTIKSITFDPLYRNIYWVDSKTQSIKFLPDSGIGNPITLVSGLSQLSDMAVDAIGRTLYWSCSKTNSINVTKLDNTTFAGVVIQGEGIMPRHIALHQAKRFLFWSDEGLGGVYRSGMDGSNRTEIAQAPNISAMAVDPYTDTVYWANAKQIHACTLNGGNRRTIWKGGVVMSLAVLSNTLYWIDGERQLMYLPLNKKDAPAHPVLHVPHITDILAVYRMVNKHSCMYGGGCPGVCLSGGGCGCVRGLGGAHCGTGAPCGPHFFACTSSPNLVKLHGLAQSSTDCIPMAWRCDGTMDCPNKSDEVGCTVCPGRFKCSDDQCIDKSLVCDGIKQCSDGNDESNCCTGPQHFQCPGTGVCIPVKFLCDQWEHCADGADEQPTYCSQRRTDAATNSSTASYIIGIIVSIIGVCFLIWGGIYYHRRIAASRNVPPDLLGTIDPLNPKPHPHKPGNTRASTINGSRMGKNMLADGTRMSTLEGTSLNSYDRNHITGASSSITGMSSMGRSIYPVNPPPPPSPATTLPPVGRTHRPYRHYRLINQPPPPTPCSTDVCDESDCTLSCRTVPLYLEAPPPTPCPTSPPSPSSRSSTYFSPLPPPPSPVPNHYDS